MILLLDIGNTRLKWALAAPTLRVKAVVHEGDPAAALANLPVHGVSAVRLAHVMGATQEKKLITAIRARWGCVPHIARSQGVADGLHSAYREPQRLGVDRWLMLRALWAESHKPFVVISAGTALTADVVDAQGQHLGGFIAPGLNALRGAVLGNTRFPVRARRLRAHAGLGRDTEQCVEQGVLLPALGAVDRAIALAPNNARRILTGGDAPLLAAHLKQFSLRPHLVLEGLMLS